MQSQDEVEEEIVLYDNRDKLLQYEAALKMAEQLDEEQEESFMLYKPKFITDTEFKLERKAPENIGDLFQNEYSREFGIFEPPQTAPINLEIFKQRSQASAIPAD